MRRCAGHQPGAIQWVRDISDMLWFPDEQWNRTHMQMTPRGELFAHATGGFVGLIPRLRPHIQDFIEGNSHLFTRSVMSSHEQLSMHLADLLRRENDLLLIRRRVLGRQDVPPPSVTGEFRAKYPSVLLLSPLALSYQGAPLSPGRPV